MNLRQELQDLLRIAVEKAGFSPEGISVVPAADRRHGDYQSNAAMVMARELKESPRTLASKIAEAFEPCDLCDPPEIAGAGFLNFRIRPAALEIRAATMMQDPRLGVPLASPRRTILVDFSSPNVAKPMHVGHIRSTILGDSLVRIARFLGNEVIADNHLGDWGTQFGKIIYGWKHLLDKEAFEKKPVAELLRLYRAVNELEAANEEAAREVRSELVSLQSGDPENRAIWEQAVKVSWQEFEKLYDLLDVKFDEHLGESFYRDQLPGLVNSLLASGIAQVSEGAVCIFFQDNPALEGKPCLIRKSDGGYLYATTDLATLQYRKERWNPDSVWYVTGAPQALHFQQIFASAQKMGLDTDTRHVAFGSILGEDRKIMKTRSGENVQLGDVLEEAVTRAAGIMSQKNPDLAPEEASKIAKTIGIGAVKYAELSQHRMTDYVFSWDKMLAFQGNTAPYLQNAYVRIQSIFRKLESGADPETAAVSILAEEERVLALKLLQFGEIVPETLEDFRINLLANYLYELANTFHSFYEACPVLKSETSVRNSRLVLCRLTANVLSTGLGLLGIRCPERM